MANYYAAYCIHEDGNKTRTYIESTEEFKPGEIVNLAYDLKAIIDFKFNDKPQI